MADTTSTTQFKADISQLKSAMQQAQRQVKLANSEFKAATSGMDDWSDSAVGLKAKLKQLDSTLKSQKTQLSLLESEYEKTKSVYGENSAAADKVKISINNMKASIANTEKQISTYTQELTDCENGTGKFADEVDDLDESVENAGEATANLSDGFTVMKGVMADLIATGIKACVSALKDLAEGAYEAYQEFDKGYDIIVSKTGATEEALNGLSESYSNVMKTVLTDTETAGSAIGEINTKFGLTGEELEDLTSKFIKFSNLNNTDVVSSIDAVQSASAAWGVESENVGDLLDLLNSASQKTGASVDSLASSLTTNAASLKDMGLNVEEAVSFMGDLEVSGVDSSTVMAALKKALASASKEGKSTADALSELQEAMENADSSSEATVAAMELFGTKAGPAIAEACQSGRLNFNDLSSAMTDYQGNVDNTYDATLDGVDKIKLAWQGMKTDVGATVSDLLNDISPEIEDLINDVQEDLKSILTSVKENAPQIKDKIKDVIEFAKSGITFLITNFDTIKETIRNIGTILAVTFVASKLASFVSMIGTMISTFAALKAATEAAETAQLLLNAAQLASPIGLVTAGVAALASAIILVAANTKSYTSNIETLTDWEQTEINKVYELKDAYEEMTATRDDNIDSINTEYDYYNQLAEELDTLVDANGEVKEGYEDRVNFILTTLNDAVGTEMELIDGVIQNYQEEKQAIEDLIETKKAQAILSSGEEAYTQAIQNQNDALQAYMSSQGVYKQNLAELSDLESQYNKIKDMSATEYANVNNLMVSETTAAEMLANEQINLQNKMNGTKGAIVESKTAMIQAEKTYEDYQTTIKNYEGLSAAIISGDVDKIKTSLTEFQYNLKTTETSNRESLEQQVVDFENRYEELKNAIEENTPGVTQEMVDQAQVMVKAAKDELNKLPGEAETAANNTADSFSSTLGSTGNKAKAKAGTNALRDSAKEGFDGGDKEAETAGNNLSLGYLAGIEYYAPNINSTAESVGAGAVSSLNKGQDSNSPSRATQTSGENFGQGFINGMNNKTNSIWTTAYNLAKTALNALKSGQKEGSPSKLTFQSGKFFTQGYINGIASQQKNLVNTVKTLVTAAVKEAAKVTNYGFSEAGSGVADMLADQLSAKTTYMVNKMTYKNEKEIAKFDKEITKLNTQSAKATAKLEKEKAKDAARIQADSDKTVANLERLKNIATEKAEKDRIDKEIAKQKEYAKKTIAGSNAAWDKTIAAEKKKYEKLIATQEKYKTAYQNASTEMINEFSDAVNAYSSKAQDLINSTLDGIGDKFQTKYDELIGKQTTLTNKLKSAGDLFSISGAGVMTVNDIQGQTKQIKEYTTKLQQIKNKVSADLFDEIASYDMKEGNAFMDGLLALSDADLKAYSNAYDEKMATAETLAEKTYKKDIDKVAADYQTELNKALADLPKQLEELGTQSMKGFIEGLTKNTDYMSTEVKTFIKSMVDNFKKDLKIASPSKVMEEIGDFTGEGLVEGLKGTIASVKKTASDMAQSLSKPLDSVKTDIGSLKASVSGNEASVGATTVNNYYDLVQNNTSPKSLSALETYQARRQQLAMLKAMT